MRSMRPGFQTSLIHLRLGEWVQNQSGILRFPQNDIPGGVVLWRTTEMVGLATQKNRIKTPVIISASIQTKSMLNHARRNIATPSFW